MDTLQLIFAFVANYFKQILDLLAGVYIGQFSFLTILLTLIVISMVITLFWKGAKG